ncbi:MAG: DCC1-like thiol-disulfide oxidoreductase family protein [Vicinamibacterales bacterium]
MTLIFYDGVCALCNGAVAFLLKRDPQGLFRFASLQGEFAARTLPKYGIVPADLDSIAVIADWNTPGERPLTRSRAVLNALDSLGGAWRRLARIARVFPVAFSDAVYSTIARIRYRTFGKYDVCPIPPPEWRDRFIE